MQRALAQSINALDAAIALDVDRSDDDRAFFTAEKATLDALFEEVEVADRAVLRHGYRERQRHQARVEVGDVVLDRGVRDGKKRATLELKKIDADAIDHLFPSDITEIVDAERHVEPALVLERTERFKNVPDFPGKADLKADLEGRAERQKQNFTARDAAALVEDGLDATLERAIARSSDALYKLEKRLLTRFPREKVYVRSFFLDVAPARKKKAEPTAG
ncbi:MAG TPA: hypothetical protein VLS89_00165 [Candidatus Nanopelagicales bacterium]|nr:hypothetical protein [Candidatus Nanopelagicales bacterium]